MNRQVRTVGEVLFMGILEVVEQTRKTLWRLGVGGEDAGYKDRRKRCPVFPEQRVSRTLRARVHSVRRNAPACAASKRPCCRVQGSYFNSRAAEGLNPAGRRAPFQLDGPNPR